MDEVTPTRRALSIGISHFAEVGDLDWEPLGFASRRAAAIEDMLARFGYTLAKPQPAEALTGELLADDIWRAVRELGPDDVLVVHLLTHGFVSRTGALYAVGADGNYHSSGDIGQWLRRLVDIPGAPLTLFLLDLCHAGMATRMSWQMSVADGDNRAWVIAACGPA
ncbi:MAG: caspase family protein, partial [Actinoplanes sp.]